MNRSQWQGAGANPGDTLLPALCACIGYYVRQFLKERALASNGFALSAGQGAASGDFAA